ncbi:MAG TPA: EamA family transporter [Candidatus Stackebrandtia faecavium]|nr:EamA family transporter [Candidatus Stackebrandtia faecavium]
MTARPPASPHLRGTTLVLAGMLSQQFGSAVAALLFPDIGALAVAALRLTIAAAVLLAICRPNPRGHTRQDWAIVSAYGLSLAAMNILIYQAIARMPLGAAVTLEVLGPLALSVIAARNAKAWLWAGLAFAGVALLGRGGLDGLNIGGAAFALGAAAMWATYILTSARAAQRFDKIDGLVWAMTIGAVASMPLGIAAAKTALTQPHVLALGAAVALMSSILPYAAELLSLRLLRPATFAILMSLAPAAAALAGFLVLDEALAAWDLIAIGLVMTASAGAVRGAATTAQPVA